MCGQKKVFNKTCKCEKSVKILSPQSATIARSHTDVISAEQVKDSGNRIYRFLRLEGECSGCIIHFCHRRSCDKKPNHTWVGWQSILCPPTHTCNRSSKKRFKNYFNKFQFCSANLRNEIKNGP